MPKKFLDANGVTQLVSLLDNYPDNEVLGAVVDAVQDALDEKASTDDATTSIHGLMSAADKTKLDSINTTGYQEIDMSIATTDWSNSAPYTYTWQNVAITANSKVTVVFKTNPRANFNGDLSYEASTGVILFTASEMPTDTISLTVQIFDTGMSISNNVSSGLSATAKQALLDCFSHVAWTNNNGSTYYNALAEALFGVSSISATLTLSNNLIRESNSLNDLKQYLTIVAHQNDGSSVIVDANDYSLNGTIALDTGNYDVSTQTITVTYGGKTATIQVPVYNAMTLDPVILPTGYTQLTMILGQRSNASSSIGSYINTGINGMDVDHVEYGFQVAQELSNGQNVEILGSNYTHYPYVRRGSSGSQKFQGLYKLSNSGLATEIDYDWETNTNYVIKAFPVVEINGTTVITFTAGSATTDSVLYMFARCSGELTPYDTAPIRLFYLKMYNNQNQLIHNYVPCKNSSDVVGVYDTISEVFLTSENEDYAFIAGEAI